MREIHLTNTLGRKKQLFKTIVPGRATIYHCGPTVYWTQHIGNMRAVIVGDIVNRTLRYAGYNVEFVRNYTDVGHLSGDNDGDADTGEDRMEKAAHREKKSPEEIASLYRAQFDADLDRLLVLTPDHRPAATEYIQPMITFVGELLAKGFAYQTDLAIYFDTSKKSDYYKLSGQKLDQLDSGAGHGDVTDGKKRNPSDFALWFFKAGAHEHALQTWANPFSSIYGFPGWHIECSAMIRDLLGKTIDIHMGGIEHISIHHTNEIAQSECVNDTPLAHYWLHNEHLDVNGAKMSKSGGTAYSLGELIDQGYHPLDLRFFFLQAHYRSKQNFTYDALDAAKTARERLSARILDMDQGGIVNAEFQAKFQEVLFDDFNTAGALAVVSDVLKSNISDADKRATIMDFDQVLGMQLGESKETLIPTEVQELLGKRQSFREDKDWKESDRLRDAIYELGYEVQDTNKGQEIQKIHL